MSAPLGAYYPPAAERFDDDSPMCAMTCKLIHNSAVWLWEYSGQVRAKAFSSAGIGPSSAAANTWVVLMRIAFPCSLLPNRAPFNYRIQLKGKSGFAGVTTTYRVAVGHGAATPYYLLSGVGSLEGSTTSTTLASLIEDSIAPSIADGENAMRTMYSLVEGSGGKAATVRVPMLYLEVWGKTSNATYPPKLYAITAEEWPGNTDYFASGGFSGGGGDPGTVP